MASCSCNLLRSLLRMQQLPRIPNGVNKLELLDNAHTFLKTSLGLTVTDFNRNFSSRRFSSTSASDIAKLEAEKLKGNKKPKTVDVPKIMLLSETGSITVVTMEEANKIAKKKTLKLTEIDNPAGITKTDKKVFKLISNAKLLEDKPNKSSSEDRDKDKSKDIKTLILRSTTSDNDVLSKVKNVKKWINKGHTVRVLIGNVGVKGDGEHVYDVIQEGLKDVRARIVQKVLKGSEIRFQVMPPKDAIKKDKKDFKEEEEEESEKENNV